MIVNSNKIVERGVIRMNMGRTRAAPTNGSPMSPAAPTTMVLRLAYLSLVVLAALLNPATSATNHTAANSTATNKSSTRGFVKQHLIILDPQQPQSTDVSNMYVQVPIAEQAETGAADGVQQTLANGEPEVADGADPSQTGKASSWTGPWPKKFQIGYIKQSDLHQVLIESLKGDPFVSLTAPKKSSGGATSSTPASAASIKGAQKSDSDSSSLMSPAAISKQWPLVGGASGSGSGHSLPKRTPATIYELQMNRPIAHIMAARHVPKLQQQPVGANGFTFQSQLQHPQLHPMDTRHHLHQHHHNQRLLQQAAKFPAAFQQRQFHLANFPGAMKSQPIYTINGFQQNELLDPVLANYQQLQQQQQQLKVPHQFIGRGRPMSDYYSSWRPVQSDASAPAVDSQPGKQSPVQQQKSILNDFQSSLADDFEEGFSAPSRPELPTTPSMNRHPMLNSYLSTSGLSTTPAPGATKSAAPKRPALASTKGSTKGSRPATGTKDAPVAGKRRVSPSAAAGGETGDGAVKGAEPEMELPRSQTTESPAMVNSTSNTAAVTPTTTVTSVGSSTAPEATTTESSTESDAETLEPDTTEPPAGAVTTTTAASTTAANNSSTAASAAAAASSTTSADLTTAMNQQTTSDSEVVTQSAGRQPEEAASAGPATRSTMREETTPANQATSESSTLKQGRATAEVEGASRGASDVQSEQVLLAAAARTGSELGKTSNQQQRANQTAAAASNNAKRVRSSSSERLQQPQSGKRDGSKIAKHVASASLEPAKTASGQRKSPQSKPSGKQVSAETKGAGSKVKAPAGEKKKSPSSKKTTRMVSQTQVLSMSAAQAQTTAQTLASLLLSKCMSSSNCLHLLDVCSTKQPNLSLASTVSERPTGATTGDTNSSISAWSMPEGLASSSLLSLASSLQADHVFQLIPQWRDALDNLVDHGSLALGYTLFLPSNEAMDRLPASTLNSWLANSDLLNQIIDNHMLDTTETFEVAGSVASSRLQLSRNNGSARSRLIRQKGLQVNQHRDRMLTVNGKRIIYANQMAPANGRIHVIDGILDWPAQQSSPSSPALLVEQPKPLLDIMDTLRQCDKFDGFVTLAEGTGLTQILKQDGPLTVFVPSNEALRKIPDEELEVIKNNSTALKEFLLYHVVNGSYFSQDLRDGQQLASLLDMKPIQVGVRVDGCSRRLVEANTSPMRRPDVVAKNGVIHILDWYLTVRDNDWCEPTRSSPNAPEAGLPQASASSSSERLQQLASEQIDSLVSYGSVVPAQLSSGPAYATRMTMPSNHKPAPSSSGPAAAAASSKLLADSLSAATQKGSLESALLSSSASLPQTPFLQQLMNMHDSSPNGLITSALSQY